MHIVRVQAARAHPPGSPENFSGTARFQDLHATKDARGIDMVAVFFAPGARTRPHVHKTYQALHIVEGEGIVATEQERRLIRPGDIVVIPAGQWHWHGATPTSAMCHISTRPVGPTDWSVPLRDWDTYAEGARGSGA
ncbi:MAG TPA: cupin domain-containing protein [bacterium]|nr:cupin domain-containing protein [bacterium]